MTGVVYNTEPRKHLFWFVHKHFDIENLSLVKEIFVDATYNTTKESIHLYAIVADEGGYGIPLGFMLMEVPKNENPNSRRAEGQATACNKAFFAKSKELGLYPHFIHTDKDWAQINAIKVLG